MTDPQVAILMLGLFIVIVLLGFPIAFTLIAMGLGFGYYAYALPNQLENVFDNRIFDLFVQNTFSVMSNEVLVAVPLFLGLCTWLGALVGRAIESGLRGQVRRRGAEPDRDRIRHRVFLVATYLVFNFFFLFSGRPLILLLPAWVQYLYDVILVALSTLWLYRAWGRSPALYGRENLAERFRKQLARMDLDVGLYLDGRTLADLGTEEVYVLAKVLPGFTGRKRLEAYKGVVREALEEGFVNAASSLEVLQQMRLSLGISDDEHRRVLEELGVEDPALLDPDSRRSLEDQIRLSGYRKSLERLQLVQRLGDGAAARDPGGDGAALQALLAAPHSAVSQVLFEAPHRIEALAAALAGAAADRTVTLGRELTKQFETVATMPAAGLPGWLAADANRVRGEFVLVIHAVPAAPTDAELPPDALRALDVLLRDLPLKQAVALAAEISGAPRNALYALALSRRGGET